MDTIHLAKALFTQARARALKTVGLSPEAMPAVNWDTTDQTSWLEDADAILSMQPALEANRDSLMGLYVAHHAADVDHDIYEHGYEFADKVLAMVARPRGTETLLWTFYADDQPYLPLLGADRPYPTRNEGVWRFGVAPHDGMQRFLDSVAKGRVPK